MAGILARPDEIFEAAFYSTDDGPSWVNLSDYVESQKGYSVGRRRQTVYDDVAPATLSVILENKNGVFNNDRDDSPFFGRVKLDVPIRYRIRWPAVGTGATRNLLSSGQSTGANSNEFTTDQGGITVDTATPPSGQTTDILWTTGVLDQVDLCVFTGEGPSRSPSDQPIYVTPGK